MVSTAKQYADRVSSTAKIIPGHGPLSTKEDLVIYAKVLEIIRDRIAAAIRDGKTLVEINEMQLTKEFDIEWGDGFLTPTNFGSLFTQALAGNEEGRDEDWDGSGAFRMTFPFPRREILGCSGGVAWA